MKILLWIYTKGLFATAYLDKFSDNFYEYNYFPQIFSLRRELENIISVPNYYWNNYPHLVLYAQLISTIELLENLYGLRSIFVKDTPLTDLEIKKWDSVFRDFWNYKYVSRYKENIPLIFSTPINQTKLETAILCMVDNFEREILIANKVNQNISFDNLFEVQAFLHRVDNFYRPSNYENFVHLDILYNNERAICRKFDYRDYLHLDN